MRAFFLQLTLLFMMVPAIGRAEFADLWMVGVVDNTVNELSIESFRSESYPGSPTEVDDHLYQAGEYPAPIGTVVEDEPASSFERALTSSDPTVHFHFNLPAGADVNTSRIRVTFRMLWGGTSSAEQPEHVIAVELNGQRVYTTDRYLEYVDFAVETPANVGTASGSEMVLSLSRVDGAPSSYTAFDYVRIEVDPTAGLDEDSDGLPRYFEEDYQLSDTDSADASADLDGDQLTALEEFQLGTNPRNSDSDNDGLPDGAEAIHRSSPLVADTDFDGVLDGAEVNGVIATQPNLADSDGDGASDSLELAVGFNPNEATDTPPNSGGIIGINFSSRHDPDGGVFGRDEVTGIIPQTNWNNTHPLIQWGGSDPIRPLATDDIATPIEDVLVDSSGNPTSSILSGVFDRANATYNQVNNRMKLFHSFLDTRSTAATEINVSDIPYANWDVYVYVASVYFGPRVTLTANGQSVEVRPYADSGVFDYREHHPSASPNPSFANVVRFSGLSGSSLALAAAITSEHSGIAAIQIVDTDADADSDNVPDWYELKYQTGATTANSDANQDGDTLTLLQEFQAGTDPNSEDSDNDGLLDHVETNTGTYVDSANTGSNPLYADSDGDGISDSVEISGTYISSPVDSDTDNDGQSDSTEIAIGSDPSTSGQPGLPIPAVTEDQLTWVINNVQLVWDHNAWSGLEYSSSSRPFFNWRIVNTAGGSGSALSLGLHGRGQALTYVFYSGGNGGFGPGNLWRSDWDGIVDLSSQLGFSGYGSNDISDPLTFSFVADRIESTDTYNITWSIINQANNEVVATDSIDAAVAHSSIIDGSYSWQATASGGVDSSEFDLPAAGVQVFSGSSIEDSPAFANYKDSDDDGMPDVWEQQYGLQILVKDGSADTDNDNLTNIEEFLAGTDPTSADTDGDGLQDDLEIASITDPTISDSRLTGAEIFSLNGDIDGNGFSDAWELLWNVSGINANDDSDLDGYTNKQEEEFGTNPFDRLSRPNLAITPVTDGVQLRFSDLPAKAELIYSTTDLDEPFEDAQLVPEIDNGNWLATIDAEEPHRYFQLLAFDIDEDSDGLSLFEEIWLGSSDSSADSQRSGVAVDTDDDGVADEVLPGDRVAYVARLQEQGALQEPSSLFDPGAEGASRFLVQASFGPTLKSINQVRRLGIDGWINEQIEDESPTWHSEFVAQVDADFNGPRTKIDYYAHDEVNDFYHGNVIMSSFARAAVQGEDQLRQRVAFALSQIFVVSRRDATLDGRPRALVNYYDLFVEHAFGNYHDLLKEVTYHPVMGIYLSHVGNQPPAPELNRYPDENYAREVMQLFSIGLWQLNPDGSRKLSAEGAPIPTYSNDEITEMARVLTGFWYAQNDWGVGGWQDGDNILPMELNPRYHDFDKKTLLNGFVIPRRSPTKENADRDVADAVRMLFEHPNTPIFISKQLIQFLVTDNPSPAYIQRIQDVFVNNGDGERGDLGAVVRSILTDPEARPATVAEDNAAGRLREPVIRNMHLGRMLNMQKYEDLVWWDWGGFSEVAFQVPLYSPSVFNFYRPDYQPSGLLAGEGKVGPVFEITNSYTAISFPNRLWNVAVSGFNYSNYQFPADYSESLVWADDPAGLVQYANLVCCQGLMSDSTKAIIQTSIETVPENDKSGRVRVALYLALMSPEGSVQR